MLQGISKKTMIDVIVPNTIEKYEELYAQVSDRVVGGGESWHTVPAELGAAIALGFALLFVWYVLSR